jgi:hypothetical protein
LLDRTHGRAFVLFTSYAAMRDVHARLEKRVRWPLFVQGTAPRTSLLRDFRATPNAVLLATASFWQGVDVAGEALSCVIIDRLPFASPADPLVSARIKVIQDRGGQPFHEYQIPLATLTLLQGLGRLIRTKTDRGVLAILDPRLTRMSYSRRFLGSLPPAPITRQPRCRRAVSGGRALSKYDKGPRFDAQVRGQLAGQPFSLKKLARRSRSWDLSCPSNLSLPVVTRPVTSRVTPSDRLTPSCPSPLSCARRILRSSGRAASDGRCHLRPMWEPHQHRRLVEPFCGGLAVSRARARARVAQ